MINVFQTGLTPVGQFDFKDSEITQIQGGEIAVFDHADLTVSDNFAPDVYSDTLRTQLRLATDFDTGPFFFVDGDRNLGQASEISVEGTSLFSTASPHIRNTNASGKFAIWGAEGFYSLTSNVVDTDTINTTTAPNTRLYVNADGLITAEKSASTAIIGYFIEYRQKSITNNRLLNIPGTNRDYDTIIVYKANSDGYETIQSIIDIINLDGTIGLPTDGTYSDGYFAFTQSVKISDAIDDLNELGELLSLNHIGLPTDNTYSDGYFNFNAGTIVADAIDNLNEEIKEITEVIFPTGHDGYILTEQGGVADYRPLSLSLYQGPVSAAVSNVASNYTVSATDFTIIGNATFGAFNVSLPNPLINRGKVLVIKKIDITGNAINVIVSGGGNIDGITPFSLTTQYQKIMVQSSGTEWLTI